MDLRWCQLVEGLARRHGVPAEAMTARMRQNETYILAHRQFVGGASDRVTTQLLERAFAEIHPAKPQAGKSPAKPRAEKSPAKPQAGKSAAKPQAGEKR